MQRRNMAQRRYLFRFMPLMVCYALILIGVSAAQRADFPAAEAA